MMTVEFANQRMKPECGFVGVLSELGQHRIERRYQIGMPPPKFLHVAFEDPSRFEFIRHSSSEVLSAAMSASALEYRVT